MNTRSTEGKNWCVHWVPMIWGTWKHDHVFSGAQFFGFLSKIEDGRENLTKELSIWGDVAYTRWIRGGERANTRKRKRSEEFRGE